MPDVFEIRYDNARILEREAELLDEGIDVSGAVTKSFSAGAECPVCLSKAPPQTRLGCGHSFCLSCLASHMKGALDACGRCPMCRAPIELSVSAG